MASARIDRDNSLNDYAVFGFRDFANNSYRITKIEPFDPQQVYPRDCLGVVSAKDELDVYRFVTEHF